MLSLKFSVQFNENINNNYSLLVMPGIMLSTSHALFQLITIALWYKLGLRGPRPPSSRAKILTPVTMLFIITLCICSNLLIHLGLSISNAVSQHRHYGICTRTGNSMVCWLQSFTYRVSQFLVSSSGSKCRLFCEISGSKQVKERIQNHSFVGRDTPSSWGELGLCCWHSSIQPTIPCLGEPH